MSCYHPLKAVNLGIKDNGKQDLKILKYNEVIRNAWAKIKGRLYPVQEVQCGNCIGCRLDHARMWATRCMLEAEKYQENYFVTLTYDNNHLPYNIIQDIDTETGEVVKQEIVETLRPKDLKDFLNNLNTNQTRHYEMHTRYYSCGEYGDKRGRPHYHAILFNTHIPDLTLAEKSHKGEVQWTSDYIQKLWGKGIIRIGSVTWDSAGYVARYVMKKQKGQGAKIYEELGIEPEFVRMSRRPGIARDYYEENKDNIYKYDEIILNKRGKALAVRPARYFDKLYDVENHETMEEIKQRRKEAQKRIEEIILSKTDLNREEYRAVQERTKENKIKVLKRYLEKE